MNVTYGEMICNLSFFFSTFCIYWKFLEGPIIFFRDLVSKMEVISTFGEPIINLEFSRKVQKLKKRGINYKIHVGGGIQTLDLLLRYKSFDKLK